MPKSPGLASPPSSPNPPQYRQNVVKSIPQIDHSSALLEYIPIFQFKEQKPLKNPYCDNQQNGEILFLTT